MSTAGVPILDPLNCLKPSTKKVIDLADSHHSVSSINHLLTIQAGDVILWFDGGHFGSLSKIAWSFVEEVMSSHNILMSCNDELGYE